MEEMNQTLPDKPNNHMVMAIVSTVLSVITCTLLGLIPAIVSIVFANQVNSKYNAGDYLGSEKASKNAKVAWIIAIVITVALLVWSIINLSSNWDQFMEGFNKAMEQQGA